ncbi:hypothetical protein F5Y19DRAFT_71459 [Xylariaceae sp. FL1651]|nr:hypothetical protein F5Y19DRAFT_71459 [Xylariaceae sp. FL1651]
MERKRKLPARAAARVEHASKKRNTTPPEPSATPAPPPTSASPQPSEPVAKEPTPATLPKSVQPGHPLPTVEKLQPDDLSHKDFQSIQESGVMAESLSRSRHKWIHDGIFEKYWTKPTKRKGVVKEESNNPAKDTMTKIGQVTITVEPHVLEATMYAVKDTKPAPTTNAAFRPIMQYGPPNGVMPPPPKPSTPSTPSVPPAPAAVTSPTKTPVKATQPGQFVRPSSQPILSAQEDDKPPAQQLPPTPAAPPAPQPPSQQTELQRPQLPASIDKPIVSPRGLESVLAAPQPAHAPAPAAAHPRPSQPSVSQSPAPINHPLHAPGVAPTLLGASTSLPAASAGGAKTTTHASKPVPAAAPGADPIIVTLAEKASEDPHLRDLMKRVAVGEAAPHELAHFQRIIDQITLDYKKKGGQQGPSAERLIVDGRTVKYFADEVRTILDIVLASNPNQRSSDLRPPPGSDPLVILLVKEALDEPKTKAMVQRIAEVKTKFADALELKSILDRLKDTIARGAAKPQQAAATNSQVTPQTAPAQVKGEDGSEGPPSGAASRKTSVSGPAQPQSTQASQQALRSKGPPPLTKPDITAIVLEFAGGNGDRYLFPKYSILEYSAEGTQVVASFLIVRKGSKLEYGGDRALDYYQPMTLRLSSHSPKVLENLARVVAPQDEVKRYMDDVMENMTRAEYVLLAMRLPRAERDEPMDDRSDTPRAELPHLPQQPGVLWDKTAPVKPASVRPTTLGMPNGEDDHYHNFIATLT